MTEKIAAKEEAWKNLDDDLVNGRVPGDSK